MYDRATEFGGMFPKGSRAHEDTLQAFLQWTKPDDVIQSFYADNAPELKSAAREMKWLSLIHI